MVRPYRELAKNQKGKLNLRRLVLQTIFLTIALLPFRLAAITTLMILAWLLACLGLHGLSEEDLRRAPLKGWRRYV